MPFSPDEALMSEVFVSSPYLTTIPGLKKGLYFFECFANDERVLGDLLISILHAMGGILNMQSLLETVGRTKNPLEQKALADSLNKNTAGFLLTHDPLITGQFYNDYTYYETVASLVKQEMSAIKVQAAGTIAFLKKKYKLKQDN